MKSRAALLLKLTLVLSLVVSLLSGCGIGMGSNERIDYPLESVSRDGNSTSYIYRAAGQTVPVIAEQLAEQRRPQQMSVEDPQRMFLAYNDELIQVEQDPDKPEDTLIEVNSKEYVRQNYNSSFLQGYLTATLLNQVFGMFGNYGGGNYRGYTAQKTYPPNTVYKKPTTQDIKQAPPMTVNKSGSIFKRGSSSASKRSGYGSDTFNRGSPSSSGTINRGSGNRSSKGGFFSSPNAPKTNFGSGKIRKRGRR